VPTVTGLLETALYVEDVARSAEFYEAVFGFTRLFAEERLCALHIGGGQVLLLFKRGASAHTAGQSPVPPHGGRGELHIAFLIAASEAEAWDRWLLARGIAVESRQRWRRGGVSLYFRDPDRHLVELATPGVWPVG